MQLATVPRNHRIATGVLAALVIAAAACALNPATGNRQLSLIGERDESSMGRQYDQETLKEMTLYGSFEL